MLELRRITKAYTTASLTQVALDGVSLAFRDNEFVAILGQSGSGKTTMLNMIGGLDRFDSGDLVIDGISTKAYKARDWDAYRNNRIGFVFQAYNLISHQSVLANVELALTLSGVGRRERKARAMAALREVGLADHVHKRPNQLSGGQMQRVAIARALVNDPEILLADEPTGALDSATSVQVMDLLKQVARDRLVIMVTHNPELAHAYATRIVELADGRVVADSAPFIPGTEDIRAARPPRRTSMSFLTALSLSFNNLMTKKGRTAMTSVAGSIGIIGIAAILALANGVNSYIAQTEEELLTTYPLAIQRTGMNMDTILAMATGAEPAQTNNADQSSNAPVTRAAQLEQAIGSVEKNDLKSLRTFIETNGGGIDSHVRAVEYEYGITPQIFLADTSTEVRQVNPSTIVDAMNVPAEHQVFSAQLQTDSFSQLPENEEVYRAAYEVKAGRWPAAADEIVLVLPENGTLSDVYEFNMGLRAHSELEGLTKRVTSKEDSAQSSSSADDSQSTQPAGYTYEELMAVKYKLVHAADTWTWDATRKVWISRTDDKDFMKGLVEEGEDLHVVGVVQVNQGEDKPPLGTGLYYTGALTKKLMEYAADSKVVKDQIANPKVNIFTGKTFEEEAKAIDPMSGFQMDSLFTIDEGKITGAFTFDEAALTSAMSSIDLSGMDLSGLSTAGEQMPALDLSALDLSAMDMSNLDMSGMDLSGIGSAAIDAKVIQDQFPQLAKIDWATVLSSSFEDGIIKEGGEAKIVATVKDLFQGFIAYQEAQAGSGKDVPTLVSEYFSSDEVASALSGVLSDPEVIDSSALTANLIGALGEDPAVAGIVSAVQEQLVGAVASQVGAQVQALLTQALGTQLQTAIASSVMQMMTALQEQIATQIESAMTQVSTNMASAMGSAISVDEQAFNEAIKFNMDPDELASMMTSLMGGRSATYESNLSRLGFADITDPSSINIYPKSFQDKDQVKQIIEAYNEDARAAGKDSKVITYSDMVGTLMKSVTDIVQMISAMLIAFVAISLVVSSIMIGIITYISVLERKKEIGILRSIGASKGDIRSVFNAETVLVGLFAGLFGVGITYLLTIPANAIIEGTLNVSGIAELPVVAAVILVAISVLLTLFAGLMPAGKAAKSDPVEALRSE